jgi:hypothetical protein
MLSVGSTLTAVSVSLHVALASTNTCVDHFEFAVSSRFKDLSILHIHLGLDRIVRVYCDNVAPVAVVVVTATPT